MPSHLAALGVGGMALPDPPVAGYALWLDVLRANTLFQDTTRTTPAAVGNLVGSWYDPTAGLAGEQTSTARPTRAATGLTFNGAHYLSGITLPVHTWPALTLIVVYQTATLIPSYQMTAHLYQATIARWGLGPCGDGAFRNGWAGTGSEVGLSSPGDAYATTTNYVATYRRSTVAWDIRRNTTDGTTINDTSYPTGATALTIGTEDIGTRNYFFYGDIRMVLIYPLRLSDSAVGEVASWAAARHSVTL